MIELQKKARGERPRYFQDPAVEKLLSITLALAGEVAVLHDRLDTVERLAETGQPFGPAAVDAYQPTGEVRAARDQWRDRFLDVVLRIVHQEMEELEREAETGAYDAAVLMVERE